ncbi:MAG: hypothetical protein IJ777_04690 [Clostridia bacterium]|nr:hypothetical protein [Clostridia bacterium]
MKNFKKITFLCFACLLLFSSICMATNTLSITEDNNSITAETPKEQESNPTLSIMNSDLYLSGDEVVVEQPIDGNAFIFANKVTLKGEINGNAFIMAKTLNIEEPAVIYHSLFAFAANITMAGSTYDTYAYASNFTLAESAYLERDLKLACNEATLNGFIHRDAYITANKISMPENAENLIGGNLHYTSNQEISFPEKAVTGEVYFSATKVIEPTIAQKIGSYVMKFAIVILYMTVVIVLATFFAPKFINKACYVTKKHPFSTAGIGILALFFVPILAFILMITGIFTLIGFAVLIVYALVLSITLAILSMSIGKAITLKLKKPSKGKFILFSFLSASVIWLLQQIPYVGGFILFFTFVFGMGVFVFAFFSKKEIEEAQ